MSYIEEMLSGMEEAEGGKGVVSLVKLEWGWHRYVDGHDFWDFWFPVKSRDQWQSQKAKAVAFMREAGSKDWPNNGIKITIDKNVLGRDPWQADKQEFTAKWQKERFNLLLQHIQESGIKFNEYVWAKVEWKADPYKVEQGEAGKTSTDQDGNPAYPTFVVPTQVFDSEAEAKAAVESGQAESANSHLSAKAQALEMLPSADELKTWLDKAKDGKAFYNKPDYFPLPELVNGKLPEPVAKKYIATCYDIEPEDVDAILSQAPF